jgi:hypothetical protein
LLACSTVCCVPKMDCSWPVEPGREVPPEGHARDDDVNNTPLKRRFLKRGEGVYRRVYAKKFMQPSGSGTQTNTVPGNSSGTISAACKDASDPHDACIASPSPGLQPTHRRPQPAPWSDLAGVCARIDKDGPGDDVHSSLACPQVPVATSNWQQARLGITLACTLQQLHQALAARCNGNRVSRRRYGASRLFVRCETIS